MVRNVKNGFSMVEVMVAMVCLSIVVLLMTSAVTTVVKSYSVSQHGDYAVMAAKAKLNELLTATSVPETRSTRGHDTFTAPNEKEYKREWTIDATSRPAQVTVWAIWTNNRGDQDTVSLTSHLDPDKICLESAPTLTAPLEVYENDGTERSTTSGTAPIYLSLFISGGSLPIGTKICELSFADVDLGKGLELFVVTGEARINEDNHLLLNADKSNGAEFSVTVNGRNCHGRANLNPREIFFKVIESLDVPDIGDFTGTIEETTSETPTSDVVGTIDADPASNVTWTLTSTDVASSFPFKVDETTTPPEIYWDRSTPLDYETKKEYLFEIKAERGSDTKTADGTITIEDVNEPPTAIVLSKNTVTAGATEGTVVATITTTDPENNPPSMRLESGGESSTDYQLFEITHLTSSGTRPNTPDTLKVASGKTIPSTANAVLSFKIVAKDYECKLAIDTFAQIFDIIIEANPCDGIDPWGPYAYAKDDSVKHADSLWKSATAFTIHYSPEPTFNQFWDWLYIGDCQ